MILAGDIGGTKTILALCDDAGTITREATFAAADFTSLEAIIDAFLRPGDRVGAACFGVAGPVVDGVAKITNLPWTIAEAALAEKLGGPRRAPQRSPGDGARHARAATLLVRDPAARRAANPTGTIAVIAPGTGLGEAVLYHDGRAYRALPSEGGHADFAPSTDEEIELLRYLRVRHHGHVSYERVLSGNGIGDLYGFCRERGAPEPAWLAAELAAGDRNAVVAHDGARGQGPGVRPRARAVRRRSSAPRPATSRSRGLTAGGVVIGGGIPPKILPALQPGALLERFNGKGRFATWTRALDVRVALEPRAALLGAAHHAIDHEGPHDRTQAQARPHASTRHRRDPRHRPEPSAASRAVRDRDLRRAPAISPAASSRPRSTT